ncbi:MAG: imidazoleglycerol-phosphate dehydratase HisB [Gammaproteobacteria bacterium]
MNDPQRRARMARKTAETEVEAELNLDGNGASELDTGLPFFDHMLAQTARHGGLFLRLRAKGDLHIDGHHTAEDCGIVFGGALEKALGDKSGVARFGSAFAPLDESLARAVVDLSGRPSLSYRARFSRTEVGGMDADLFREFFQSLVNHAKITLHLDLLRGVNAHHQAECIFKAFGLALRAAAAKTGGGAPSTKGVL